MRVETSPQHVRYVHSIPELPAGCIRRPRVESILNRLPDHRLTLVTAPAGSGKTVLLSEWARRQRGNRPVAWLNCSAIADTPTVFWDVFTSVLADAAAATGPDWSRTFRSSGLPAGQHTLATVLEWLTTLPTGTTIICDDYQQITAHAAHSGMQYLLQNLPPTFHLVIAARSAPPLQIHRARLQNWVLDVRVADLAFTDEEVERLLIANHVPRSRDDVRDLLGNTEGWAAGLRLGIIAIPYRPSSPRLGLRSSSTEAANGYLLEQVLDQLPSADRDFLLDTCVVQEFDRSLARVLTRDDHTGRDLEELAARIGFVTRTAYPEPTYRYHPMFAELLRVELRRSDPDRFARQHLRAADWYRRQQNGPLAVEHAQRGGDLPTAAHLLALHALPLATQGRLPYLNQLLQGFPSQDGQPDPYVALARAITLVFDNQPDRAQALLDWAGQSMPLDSDLDSRRLAVVRRTTAALIGRYRGNAESVLATLDGDEPGLPGPDDTGFVPVDLDLRALWRASRSAALLYDDQLEAARAAALLAEQDVAAGAGGRCLVTALGVQALVAALRGHLSVAQESVNRLAQFAEVRDWTNAPFVAQADFAAAWIAMERAQFANADAALTAAERRWARVRTGPAGVGAQLLRARLIAVSGGDVGVAVRLLDDAFDRGPDLRSPLLLRLATLVRTEIALARGDAAAAELSAASGPRLLQRYVAARAGRTADAPHELDRHDDRGLLVRLLLAEAIIEERAGRRGAADRLLEAALDLAETEGFRLPFVQLKGRVHALLLNSHVAQVRHGSLVATLLAATGAKGDGTADLLEPLTGRELEVLHFLATAMDSDEIASVMFLSRHTVRSHTKSIYRKLSVQNRRDAIRRAAAIGVL